MFFMMARRIQGSSVLTGWKWNVLQKETKRTKETESVGKVFEREFQAKARTTSRDGGDAIKD